MRITPGKGGWVAVDGMVRPGVTYLKFSPSATGRLRVTQVFLDGPPADDEPITGEDLRTFPLAAIEAVVNTELEQSVRQRCGEYAPDLSTLASYFATTIGPLTRKAKEGDWVSMSFAAQFSQEQREAAGLGHVVPPQAVRQLPAEIDTEYRLTSGPTEGLTDEFLHRLRRAYTAAVLRGESPNRAIADQIDTATDQVRNVQRWVYIARQRGIMQPGSRGRAG